MRPSKPIGGVGLIGLALVAGAPVDWCCAAERSVELAAAASACLALNAEPLRLSSDAPAIAAAPAPSDGAVETGTDPSKLLLRFEMNPQYIDLPDDGYLLSTNLKLDVPFTKSIGVAFEVPVIHAGGFPSPIDDQFGLGDIFIRGRHVWSFEKSSLIAGAEVGLKTADDELLGSGKWQLNPSLAYVHYLSNEYLLAVAGKQRLSIAGDDDRAEINQSELRLIGIYINPNGWWLQADYQPKVNWEQDGDVSHLLEFEAGTMLSRSVGLSIRPGVGFGENRERDWSVGFGLRLFF